MRQADHVDHHPAIRPDPDTCSTGNPNRCIDPTCPCRTFDTDLPPDQLGQTRCLDPHHPDQCCPGQPCAALTQPDGIDTDVINARLDTTGSETVDQRQPVGITLHTVDTVRRGKLYVDLSPCCQTGRHRP